MNSLVRNISLAFVIGMILGIVPSDVLARCEKKKEHKKICVDYVVIGSCAGAVVAKRLTDDKKTSVLLLEAGDDNNTNPLLVDSSAAVFAANVLNPEVTYQGRNQIQPQLGGGFYDFVNARIKGGGSSHNGLQVVWGSRFYWDSIANIVGSDWSSDKVFARYKAFDDYINTAVPPVIPSPARGSNGPWKNAASPSVLTDDAEYLVRAFESPLVSGVPRVEDYNNPDTPIGPFGRWDYQEQYDLPNFPRESAAFAFLGPDVLDAEGHGVNGRKLELLVRATAVALLWDESDPTKVTGVRYSRDGEFFDVFVREEVIVSAGVLSAPFLQRNGVGPQAVLENAGVNPRVINETIGSVSNHVGVFAFVVAPGEQLSTPNEPWAVFAPGAFLPAQLPVTPGSHREIQWIAIDLAPLGSPGIIQLFPVLVTPKSVGPISIQNDDPFKIPLYDNGYLTNDEDTQRLIEALRTGLAGNFNAATGQFETGLIGYFSQNAPPGGNPNWTLADPALFAALADPDDTQLINYIKANLGQAYHYTSTVPMGQDAQTSAVDAHGRVHNVKGLRVADVSILPIIPDGNTCTPAILVGWTIAEFILAGQ